MPALKKISLFQFKNYQQQSFDLGAKVTGICGKNGIGKTNLLDAIYYLCFTRSYFSRQDGNNVLSGKTGFRIEGEFQNGGEPEKAVCVLRETGKKEFSINGEAYEKFSHHVGRYTCVVIAPDDAVLVTGGSDERRKFVDAMLCQVDVDYLRHLITYNKVLLQRNSLLKSFFETGRQDMELLKVLDDQLTQPGVYIFEKRKIFLGSFLPLVTHYYADIAGVKENISTSYESDLLSSSWADLFTANRQKDLHSMRTNAGVQKDDLVFQFNDQPFKNIASQGQRKSLLFALKLAETEVLTTEKGFPPLLLLDDVFEKLDEDRINNLLKKVCSESNGQVIITDTDEKRFAATMKRLEIPYQLINL